MGVITAPDAPAPKDRAASTPSAQPSSGTLGALVAWLATPLHLFAVLLAAVPVILVLLYIQALGVNMPFWDEWDNAAIIAIKTADGTLNFGDLTRQNYDHRLFFSNSLTMLTTLLTNWNLRVEMLVSFGLALSVLLLLLNMAWRAQPRLLLIVIVPFSAIIFTLRHHTNWLWGQQSSWFFTVFFLVAALWWVYTRPQQTRTVVVAGLLALASNFSTLHGFITWGAVGALMLLSGYRKPVHYGLLACMAVLAVVVYSINYDFGMLGANEDGNSAGLVRNPVNVLLYALVYIGNPFVPTLNDAAPLAGLLALGGLALVGLNSYILWRATGSLRAAAPWLSLALWVVGVGIITGLGRAHIFPDVYAAQPLLDRYVLPVTLFWVGVFALVALVALQTPRFGTRSLAGVVMALNVPFMVLLVGLHLFMNAATLQRGPLLSDQNLDCMLRFQAARNTRCLAFTYLKQTPLITVVERVNDLARLQLTSFAGREPLYTTVIPFYRVGRQPEQPSGSGFRFYDVTPATQYIVYRQPLDARTEFRLTVPDVPTDVILGGAITFEKEEGVTPALGAATFRIGLRSPLLGDRVLREIIHDPLIDDDIRAFQINLNEYRGEQVGIVLLASANTETPVDQPLWIDPVLLVRPG